MLRTCVLVLTVGIAAAFDSSEMRMLEDEYAVEKRSEPFRLPREGRSYDETAGPLIRFGKRDMEGAPLIRFGRTPDAQPLIRFGKRTPDGAPLIRFGRNPEAQPLIRFGKRSQGAPLISISERCLVGRSHIAPDLLPSSSCTPHQTTPHFSIRVPSVLY
ncbi:hypothetical protein Aduo_013542 [Ancylostoma duodenale]